MRNIFDLEIGYIKDKHIKEATQKLVDMLPEYFFKVPASSTGKYHPKCSNVECGLVHHTKIAVRIAKELMDNAMLFNNFSSHDQDLIILALLLHDGFKHGLTEEKYVRFDHPVISANFIKEHGKEVGLTKEEIDTLYDLVAAHMGVFNTSKYSDVVLPLPKTAMQKFVHMCDDLSSKRFIDVEFDDNHNIVN